MLVRLLQVFDRVDLAPDAQPKEGFPPEEWKEAKEDRQSWEKVWPKSHLTAFVNVSIYPRFTSGCRVVDPLFLQGGLWVRLHEAAAVDTA